MQLVQIPGHHLFDEFTGLGIDFRAVDENLADIRTQVITHGADNDVAVLIDQERRLALLGGCFDGGPQLQQVIEVPLQFFGALAHTGGAHDKPHAFRHFELAHGFFQFGAFLTLDTP